MNVDRNIKRLLSKIGVLSRRSKFYNSSYYKITYLNGEEIDVRFFDHFLLRTDRMLNIVRTSYGLYTIKDDYTGISITLDSDNIVAYLKAYFIVHQEIHNSTKSLKESCIAMERQYTTLYQKCLNQTKKYSEYLEMFEEISDMAKLIDDQKKEINQLKAKVNTLENSYTEKVKENKTLTKKVNSFNNELNRYKAWMKKIKDVIFLIIMLDWTEHFLCLMK